MNRRRFLQSAGVVSATLAFPKAARALTLGVPSDQPWRTFEVTTRVEVVKPSGTTRVWLPAALIRDTQFQKTLANDYRAEGGTAELVRKDADSLGIVSATFPEGVRPVLTLTSRVTTRGYAVDLAKPGTAPKPDPDLAYWLQPSKLLPVDGIVKVELDRGEKRPADLENGYGSAGHCHALRILGRLFFDGGDPFPDNAQRKLDSFRKFRTSRHAGDFNSKLNYGTCDRCGDSGENRLRSQ